MQLDSIGKYLRKYRREKGLSQEALAEKINLSSNYIGLPESFPATQAAPEADDPGPRGAYSNCPENN